MLILYRDTHLQICGDMFSCLNFTAFLLYDLVLDLSQHMSPAQLLQLRTSQSEALVLSLLRTWTLSFQKGKDSQPHGLAMCDCDALCFAGKVVFFKAVPFL